MLDLMNGAAQKDVTVQICNLKTNDNNSASNHQRHNLLLKYTINHLGNLIVLVTSSQIVIARSLLILPCFSMLVGMSFMGVGFHPFCQEQSHYSIVPTNLTHVGRHFFCIQNYFGKVRLFSSDETRSELIVG